MVFLHSCHPVILSFPLYPFLKIKFFGNSFPEILLRTCNLNFSLSEDVLRGLSLSTEFWADSAFYFQYFKNVFLFLSRCCHRLLYVFFLVMCNTSSFIFYAICWKNWDFLSFRAGVPSPRAKVLLWGLLRTGYCLLSTPSLITPIHRHADHCFRILSIMDLAHCILTLIFNVCS